VYRARQRAHPHDLESHGRPLEYMGSHAYLVQRETAAELAEQARSKKLMPQSLQGATFTISSLGGIGGTGFTPIINPPEVAILGVARAKWQPRYVNDELKKRLIVPLALSYDHRAIDGAEAARFLAGLAEQLEDVRYLAL